MRVILVGGTLLTGIGAERDDAQREMAIVVDVNVNFMRCSAAAAATAAVHPHPPPPPPPLVLVVAVRPSAARRQAGLSALVRLFDRRKSITRGILVPFYDRTLVVYQYTM